MIVEVVLEGRLVYPWYNILGAMLCEVKTKDEVWFAFGIIRNEGICEGCVIDLFGSNSFAIVAWLAWAAFGMTLGHTIPCHSTMGKDNAAIPRSHAHSLVFDIFLLFKSESKIPFAPHDFIPFPSHIFNHFLVIK
ncbi:hypothetical protein L3055_11180 [Corynebacterium sp. MC-02]|uniref:hypothetical protein n=1 Tax=Corynebacterium pseudokroppenstedtii TaxID=2804917 RepID=UPI001F1E8275|nr:hypothetical protein [Corynebacterium pseudokroppenstedtii]MCF8704088.1 hypothetical protein [Corynebacterium pseudokroppenstedtii]